jgi:hypothetical protein
MAFLLQAGYMPKIKVIGKAFPFIRNKFYAPQSINYIRLPIVATDLYPLVSFTEGRFSGEAPRVLRRREKIDARADY